MALTDTFVDEHIRAQRDRLTSPFYPHRKHWPTCLFHHAPIENAVSILKDGHLRSRNDAANQRPRDVAAPGVIEARDHAHDRVRLYFRPKTPTQWHIEGIRKPGECKYGDATHAGVLVMFALDAKSVLTRPDVMFSDRNMQLGATAPGNSKAYFENIDFMKVYSEGGTGGDHSVIDVRAAEVLPVSPLPLDDCLKAIFLRSEPEREFLLFSLGQQRERWAPYCQVSDALKVFQKEYTFVQELRLTPNGIVFRLNPRRDGQNIKVAINLTGPDGTRIADFFNNDHAPRPNHPYVNWIWERKIKDGRYLVEVHLEDTLAYRARMQLGDTLF